MDIIEQKKQARRAGFSRRMAAFAQRADAPERAARYLRDYVQSVGNPQIISTYMAIRTELDPLPVMKGLFAAGHRIVVPVIVGAGRPLTFKEWTPDAEMIEGAFGAFIPRDGEILTPDMLVVPLVSFDRAGYRLGYGGGFYDRTLELLRAKKPVKAVGYAFAAQEGVVPVEITDQQLDAVVTESGVLMV